MFKHCAICFIFLVIAIPALAGTITFYAGDFDPSHPNANALANELDASYLGGAHTYQPFTVPSGGWTVTGLFSNDLMDFTVTSAYWEIRSGVSVGNGGTLLYSGTDNSPIVTPTGRSGFGFTEYTVEVDALNISLPGGQYWMNVTPENPGAQGRAFNSNTFGLNSVGTVDQNNAFFNSAFFGANFSNATDYGGGVYPAFSGGVLTDGVATPEPGSATLMFGGAALLWAGLRRHRA